jgi:hypothetical protein
MKNLTYVALMALLSVSSLMASHQSDTTTLSQSDENSEYLLDDITKKTLEYLDYQDLANFRFTTKKNMMHVSNVLTRRVVDIRALHWIQNNDQKNIKIIKLSDGSEDVEGFETISFDSVEGLSYVAKRIYEEAFFNNLTINPNFKDKIIEYLLDKTGNKEEPLQGLKVYKENIQPVIYFKEFEKALKHALNHDLKKPHHIIVKFTEDDYDTSHTSLYNFLENNIEHTVVLFLNLHVPGAIMQCSFEYLCGECTTVKNLLVVDDGSLGVIKRGFFNDSSNLKKVTLSFPNLTTIEENFFSTCNNLEEINLSLPSLTETGDYFLTECNNLKKVALRLPNVKTIGLGFLAFNNLKKVALRLPNVKTIHRMFLAYSLNLKQLDLRGLENLTSIKAFFLHDCKNLEQLFVKDEADKVRWMKLLDSHESNKHLKSLLTIKDTPQNSEENNQETASTSIQTGYMSNTKFSTDLEGVD